MRIVPAHPPWELTFLLDAAYHPELTVTASNEPVLELSVADDGLSVSFHTQWRCTTQKYGHDPQFNYTLTAPLQDGEVRLVWLNYVCQLYLNGELMDEEWPLGDIHGGIWTILHNEGVRGCAVRPAAADDRSPPKTLTFQGSEFAIPGHNTYIGDCMPFCRDGSYCFYYLFDRRHHKSKQGLGAHQWGQLTSSDLKTWIDQPLAIRVTEQWEGSICTGSLLQENDTTYAFYAVRMADGSPARLSWATSQDGVNYEKSGRYFTLTAPYDPVSARDPMVFKDAASQYHMLVTTSVAEAGVYGGCLAHLISPDLETWTQCEPFIVPGYADQPECSDYFEWNGWYYLIFSNYATARYRMSRQPFGPWIRPAFDELDAHELHVSKTAAFRGRRLMTGFLSTQRNLYAGTAVTHELIQREDGTLGAGHVPELLPAFAAKAEIGDVALDAGSGRKTRLLVKDAVHFRLRGMLVSQAPGTLTGVQIWFDHDERVYDLLVDFDNDSVRLMAPGETNPTGNGQMPLTGLALMGRMTMDLIVYGDVIDVALADGRMITCRLERLPGSTVSMAFYAQAGRAAFCRGWYHVNRNEEDAT